MTGPLKDMASKDMLSMGHPNPPPTAIVTASVRRVRADFASGLMQPYKVRAL
jgi:hypothetical protein